MNCDQCGEDKIALTVFRGELACNDCYLSTPTHHDFTESEEPREQRENSAAISASHVAELYNEGVGAPWVSDTGATVIPPTFQFTADPVMAEVANLSFGAPANDLGAWADSDNNSLRSDYGELEPLLGWDLILLLTD